MKKLQLLLLACALFIPFALPAQNAAPVPTGDQQHKPDVDGHLNKLTEALSLSTEQQEKIRPILKNFLEKREQVFADGQLSDADRKAKIQALHEQADKQVRTLLSNEQKTKLTQLEENSHSH
jgi:Spy/CpxP family protein refolding chaperone